MNLTETLNRFLQQSLEHRSGELYKTFEWTTSIIFNPTQLLISCLISIYMCVSQKNFEV